MISQKEEMRTGTESSGVVLHDMIERIYFYFIIFSQKRNGKRETHGRRISSLGGAGCLWACGLLMILVVVCTVMLEPKNICTAKNICTRFASKKKTQHQTTSHNSKNGRFCYRTAPPPSASFGNFSAKN